MTRKIAVFMAAATLGCAHTVTSLDDSDASPTFGNSDAGPGFGNPNGSGNTGPLSLFAHSGSTLYQLDPENLTAPLQTVGDFDCIAQQKGGASSMTDLAVAKDGTLYGVSEVAAYPLMVQNGVVHCTATWTLPPNTRFYGLTIAPENTVAATETLIAANGLGQLYRIDAVSGNATQVGTLGVDTVTGDPWSLSGDIVFLANGGNPIGFATVRTCGKTGTSTCSTVDTVIQVDVSAIKPGTQSVLKSVRGVAKSPSQTFGSMFGIVAYKDKVIGFSNKGDIVSINNTNGAATLISTAANVKFAGAGVSTLAPVIAPPN
jgi:hypothetical protein